MQHIQHDPINRSVILLVPKQATFTYERAIAMDPRLGGTIHVRVLSPDNLAELALVETGSPHSARLDSTGRSLILGHLLRTYSAQLPYFQNSAHTPGLAGEIDSSFSEFERAGHDLSTIDQLIFEASESSESDQQAIARKLADLRTLYMLYQNYVTAHGFDPFDRQQKAHQAVENCELLQRSMVVIDDFYDFTAYERSLICSLAKTAQSVLISMLFDPNAPILNNPHLIPDEMGVFHQTELAYRKLYFTLQECGVVVDPPMLMKSFHRFKTANLKKIESAFELSNNPPAIADGSVQLQLAADYSDEVSIAAATIQKLLIDGYRKRDITVLARSIDQYESAIQTIFAEHRIAFFVDKRRLAVHHPLIRAIHAISRIVISQWGNEAVIELLRCGLVGITLAQADLIEDYLKQHNLSREAWTIDQPWNFHKTADEENDRVLSHFSAADVEEINLIRVRLRKILSSMTHPDWVRSEITVQERVNDLFAAITAFGIPTALVQLIERDEAQERLQESAEFELGWTRLIELADQLVDLLGETTISGQQFFGLVQTSLAEMELAITPPTVDQVLVGSIDRTRANEPKAVIFLGMNSDQFPMTITEKAILNDRDRRLLNLKGIEVEPPSRQKLLQEQFLGYLSLTRCSEKLILIRTHRDDEGNEKEPSPFWQYVVETFPDIQIRPSPDEIDKITTPSRLLINLLSHIRSNELETDLQIGMYNWLTGTTTDAIQRLRDSAWLSLSYMNQPVLTEPVKSTIFHSPLYASVSRIESFAACPFQHFVRHGLRLQEPPSRNISAIDLGNLYHNVLEKIVRHTIEKHVDFTSSAEITPEQIHAIAQEAGQELRNQVFLSSAQNRYTLEHLEEVVDRLVRTQQELLRQGTLRPAFAELEYGRSGDLPPLELTTPDGKQIILNGKIDRIDVDYQRCKYAVIDYKLSGQSLDLSSVVHGLMLQLLTYLIVVNASSRKLTGKQLTPIAAFYQKVIRSIESIDDPDAAPEPGDALYMKPARPAGVINLAGRTELDQSLEDSGKSEYYAMGFTKEGKIDSRGTQLVTEEQFEDLMKFVRDKIIALCQDLMNGDISLAPYLIDKTSPCTKCSYHSVCRFDKLINHYRRLDHISRGDALEFIELHVRGEKK